MTESRTLQAEDHVAHYRIVGPLGAGGMGEVYLAQDGKLERNVALKVLPPDLVRNEERVRRFVQEAKSASSLNHPNIVTIYEIGAEPVISAAGETSSDPVRYISMELVSGRTLSTRIHEENVDLRTLLGYLAQAAEGIAKAHAAGIVHRDLKPGNIMVSDDGFAKVLDFGLAKLTEKQGPEPSATALTRNVEETAEGVVMGTVHYMSPEQVQGKSVDHRSDVFSFGCILYEAATRRRPFTGDSNVETMHRILHDAPPAIEELNPAVPNELRRLIRRCLRKAPDQRAQSMKDVALELREIVEEYDELSASATAAGSGSGLVAPVPAGRRLPLVPVVVVGALVVAAAVYFGLRGRTGGGGAAHPLEAARMTTVTQSGQVGDAAISRDGRYIAYLARKAEGTALFVRQVATGADIQVIAPTTRPIGNPAFSPDGNYLFYTDIKPDTPRYRTLYRMPSLGGAPEERAFDVDSRVIFSPDGARMAFARFVTGGGGTIQTMPSAGGEPHELIRFAPAEVLANDLSWSPDGRWIAAPVFNPPPSTRSVVVLVDAETGERTDAYTRSPAFFQGVAWAGGKDDDGFILTSIDLTLSTSPQVFRVSYPGGAPRRITNDVDAYTHPSVATDGAVSVVRESYRPGLLAIDPEGGTPREFLRSTSADNAPSQFDVGENAVVYTRPREKGSQLCVQGPDDDAPRLIPGRGGLIFGLKCGGRSVFFSELDVESGKVSMWRVGLDGSGLRGLNVTSTNVAAVSPDGKYLAYIPDDNQTTLWLLDTEGGSPRQIAEGTTGRNGLVRFSPDGTRILAEFNDTTGTLVRSVYKVLPVTGGTPPQTVSIPEKGIPLDWIPGENAIAYYDTGDPVRNRWRLPLDGGKPTPLTALTTGRITGGQISPDGRKLALRVDLGDGDGIWLVDRDRHQAKQLAVLSPRRVYWISWLRNGSRIVAAAGEPTRDVVLIRNVQ